jgi:hypothetical protein
LSWQSSVAAPAADCPGIAGACPSLPGCSVNPRRVIVGLGIITRERGYLDGSGYAHRDRPGGRCGAGGAGTASAMVKDAGASPEALVRRRLDGESGAGPVLDGREQALVMAGLTRGGADGVCELIAAVRALRDLAGGAGARAGKHGDRSWLDSVFRVLAGGAGPVLVPGLARAGNSSRQALQAAVFEVLRIAGEWSAGGF